MAAPLSLLLDIADVYSNFYDIKNLSGSFGCVRAENKRTRIKITYLIVDIKAVFSKRHCDAVYIYFL